MSKTTTLTLTVSLVRGANGNIDKDASLLSAGEAIDKFVAEREIESDNIASAVSALFDQYRGTSCNMPFVCSRVAASLNATPANVKAMEERVADYVRANSTKDKEPKTRLFHISKGKGGGVQRVSDIKPEASASEGSESSDSPESAEL